MDDTFLLLREKRLVSECDVTKTFAARTLFDNLTLHSTKTALLRKIMVERGYDRYAEALDYLGAAR